MHQTHSQPKQQQYITLLDKCTRKIFLYQIRDPSLRQDMAEKYGKIRSLISNEFIQRIAKEYMKELQIKLRKYIMRAKEREKQQQLQRFKQNMQLPDFVQIAAEKKQQYHAIGKNSANQYQQQQYYNQSKRGPLMQNQGNQYQQEKSSFVAKWNNYSHYNNNQSNGQQHQQVQQQPTSQTRPLMTSTSKKQWQNNYKPHSFNKNLNYELANKLSMKNSSNIFASHSTSSTPKPRQNLSTTSLFKGNGNNNRDNLLRSDNNRSMTMMNNNSMTMTNVNRRKMIANNEELEESGRFGNKNAGGRNSSKSLKQLQHRIYQELKQFQQNKSKKQSQSLNKSFSQRSIQKIINEKQKSNNKKQLNNSINNSSNNRSINHRDSSPQNNIPVTQQTVKQVSKQSIDEILKFKLGNCDFEAYKKQQQGFGEHSHQNEEEDHYNEHEEHERGSQFSNMSQISHNHSNDQKSSIATSSQKKLYYNDSMFPPIQEQTERDSESQRYPEEPLRFGQTTNPTNALRQQLEERQKMFFASFAKGGASPSNELILSKEYTQQSDERMMLDSFNPQYQQQSSLQSAISSMNNSKAINVDQSIGHSKKISQSLYQSAEKKSDFTENFLQSDLHKSIMQSIKKSREMYPLQGDNNDINQQEGKIPYRPATSQITSFSSSLYASSSQNNETIFTSPELLNQCRNFLKKTQQINFENSGLGSNFNSSLKKSKFESPTNSQQKSLKFSIQQNNINKNDTVMLHFPQPITITESITKDYYEHYGHDSNFSQAKINSMFESKQSSVQRNIEFQTYSKPQEMIEMSVQGNPYIQNENNGSSYMSSLQNSINQGGNQVNNSIKNFNKDQISSSAKKEEPLIIGHSRKNSSIKRHSQIQETLTGHQPTIMQFNLSVSQQQPQMINQMKSTSQNNEQNYRTSEFRQVVEQQISMGSSYSQNKLYKFIDLEDIIDRLLEANEGNLEMDSTWLKHTIANHCIFQPPINQFLSHLLNEFIIQPSQTHNFVDILDILYEYYCEQCPNYRPRKSPVSDIYSLLDIEKKGFIDESDIQNFIKQLEKADIQEIDDINSLLQQTFELADFLSIKKIGYVNLYVIKNEDCFDTLWQYLRQYDFEVEGEEDVQ